MARVNVTQVFSAFLDEKHKSVGPVRCDAIAIYSYNQPLLVRAGKRLLLCEQDRSLYTRTTTQHLSSLYSLLIPHERDFEILRIPADDVRQALRSDVAFEEIVIKHADERIDGAYAREACEECSREISTVEGGSIANRHHAESCSLHDPGKP